MRQLKEEETKKSKHLKEREKPLQEIYEQLE